MPQLASYLRAIGCRAAISSDRITARLANGPGLSPAPRAVLFLRPLFLNFPDTPLVSVTTITLIIALRRTVPGASAEHQRRRIFNFRLKNASVINRSDILPRETPGKNGQCFSSIGEPYIKPEINISAMTLKLIIPLMAITTRLIR